MEPAVGHVILSYFLQTHHPPRSATQIQTGSSALASLFLYIQSHQVFRHNSLSYSENSHPHTSLDFVARMLPFFSNSDRRGDGGGVAFWQRGFFWVGSSRSDPWLMLSFPGADDSGAVNLLDPNAWRVILPAQEHRNIHKLKTKILSFKYDSSLKFHHFVTYFASPQDISVGCSDIF